VEPPLDNRADGGQDPVGVVEHLPIVDADHEESEGREEGIPLDIGPAVSGLGMVRLAVALDQQAISDQEIGPLPRAEGEPRLRGRGDPALVQQDTENALGA
jgi:hypothetical protein